MQKAHAVSKDHAPEKNAAEAERLRTLGVQVNGGYVGDHVAVSRIEYDSGEKKSRASCRCFTPAEAWARAELAEQPPHGCRCGSKCLAAR